MADSYVETVAGELADLALADQAASGDIGIVDMIGEVLGASSQTLQETYLTAIRVRRAEARAREILAQRQANNYAAAPAPKAAPLQGVSADTAETIADPIVADTTPAAKTAPQDAPAAGVPRRVTR